MKFKKFLSALIAAVCFCTGTVTVSFAEDTQSYIEEENLIPAYIIADNPTVMLAIYGNMAECTSTVTGNDAVCITVEQTLQKCGLFWIWSNVSGAHWAKTVNSSSIWACNTAYNLSSGKYRLKTVFTLTDSTGRTEVLDPIYTQERRVS